jgi:NTP pyrophosphatase (non-canonical NTP hydrolase)
MAQFAKFRSFHTTNANWFRDTFSQRICNDVINLEGIPQDLVDMQARLIKEETKEFIEAVDNLYLDQSSECKAELLKELADLVFVCFQFAAAFNLDLDEASRRVFDSNMSKLDVNGLPIFREDGKVLKGPNYTEPTLTDLVQ